MLALTGCVQPAIAPSIDAALARALDRIGIALIRANGGGCCGAVSEHLGAHDEAMRFARRNIDAWWPHIEQGAEAIIVTASGCGVSVKDYGHLLRDDPAYADKAARVASLTRDPVEIIAAEWKRFAPLVAMDHGPQRVAFHSPCTLQHGQRLDGRVEEILEAIGLELAPVRDAHLCCGSAGTYSLLQPVLSQQLKTNKLAAPGSVAARLYRDRQHRLPHPPCERHRAAGAPLGGNFRRAAAHSLMNDGARASRADYRRFLAIPTRWMDNDTYGHVNNVVYYSYFDTAVNEHLIAEGGLDMRTGPQIGLVVETRCLYHRPLSFPQIIDAGLRVTRLGTSSVTYDIGLFERGEDDPAATGYFVHVWVERASGRPTAVPAAIRTALEPLLDPGRA